MVIAVASFCMACIRRGRTVGTGIGSAAPTPVRAAEAEAFLAAALDEAGLWESRADLPDVGRRRVRRAGEAAARPVDDVRGRPPTGGMGSRSWPGVR